MELLFAVVLLFCLVQTLQGFVIQRQPSNLSEYRKINERSLANRQKSSNSIPLLSKPDVNLLHATPSSPEETSESPDWKLIALFATVSFFYWYWMVFGSLVASQGWPFLPDFLPLHPGWPPSDADLQPVLEDSQNFFYLSTLLQNEDAPYVQPVRLVAFNIPEAWIFAYLPLLWNDPKRTNKWILLGLWAVLGINLTNAFLAPYLLVTQLRISTPREGDSNDTKNRLFAWSFGVIATSVASYALYQIMFVASPGDWKDFIMLTTQDRTYLAFCVDLVLFSLFQPLVISRVRRADNRGVDYIPFVGLISWLFES